MTLVPWSESLEPSPFHPRYVGAGRGGNNRGCVRYRRRRNIAMHCCRMRFRYCQSSRRGNRLIQNVQGLATDWYGRNLEWLPSRDIHFAQTRCAGGCTKTAPTAAAVANTRAPENGCTVLFANGSTFTRGFGSHLMILLENFGAKLTAVNFNQAPPAGALRTLANKLRISSVVYPEWPIQGKAE